VPLELPTTKHKKTINTIIKQQRNNPKETYCSTLYSSSRSVIKSESYREHVLQITMLNMTIFKSYKGEQQ
jgi:hypothetical protein